MKLTLKIWRQKNNKAKGELKTYPIDGIEGRKGCRPETVQSDVIQFIDPVDNQLSV